MNPTLKKAIIVTKEYFIIALGLFVYTISWNLFLIPNQMVGGGVTGIAAIIQYATGFNISYSYFIINVLLLVLGIKLLGKSFGIKTVYAIIVNSILLSVEPRFLSPEFVEQFSQNGLMLCTIIGGAMAGLGITMAFTQGGSTGGTDIIALILSKYRNISPGRSIVFCDIIIIASTLVIPNGNPLSIKLSYVIYGYIMAAVLSFVMDALLAGAKQSVQMFIMSRNYEKITQRIANEAHRGVTILDGEGGFTRQPCKVLLVLTRKKETPFIMKLIREEDPNAFVTTGSVNGVYGQGFDTYRAKKSIENL